MRCSVILLALLVAGSTRTVSAQHGTLTGGLRVEPVPTLSVGFEPMQDLGAELLWLPRMDILEYRLDGPLASGALGGRVNWNHRFSDRSHRVLSFSAQRFYTPEVLQVASVAYGVERYRLSSGRFRVTLQGGLFYLRHLKPGGGYLYPNGAVFPFFSSGFRFTSRKAR